jgi:hypothetical protein
MLAVHTSLLVVHSGHDAGMAGTTDRRSADDVVFAD